MGIYNTLRKGINKMDLKKTIARRRFLNELTKNKRKKLREEHRCIWCKKKVKPIITYPQFCEEHNPKNRKKRKEGDL